MNKVAKMNSQARIDMLVEALGKAALAMWNSESNMDNEAAEIEAVLGYLSQFPTPAPIPDAAEGVEVAAQMIYESWQAIDGYVPWTPRGNSLKQGEARRIAERIVRALRDGGGVGEMVSALERIATLHIIPPYTTPQSSQLMMLKGIADHALESYRAAAPPSKLEPTTSQAGVGE